MELFGQELRYHPAVTEDAYARVTAFLAKHLWSGE
jgi:hypothetical protein